MKLLTQLNSSLRFTYLRTMKSYHLRKILMQILTTIVMSSMKMNLVHLLGQDATLLECLRLKLTTSSSPRTCQTKRVNIRLLTLLTLVAQHTFLPLQVTTTRRSNLIKEGKEKETKERKNHQKR